MKKILSVLLVGVLFFSSLTMTFADSNSVYDYKMKLEQYLDSGYDFMGRRGEKLYFQLRDEYAGGNILKTMEFDIKTIDMQLKNTAKYAKENKEVHLLGLFAGAKLFLGI